MSPNNCDVCGHDRSMCICKAKQIGGNHYAAEYQHWDWAMDVRLGYFESAATKYLFRWYKKNGIEDLEKARSYLLKAKEGYLEGRWDNKCLHVDSWPMARDKAEILFDAFANSSEVPIIEADLCLQIAQWHNDVDLSILIGIIGAHVEATRGVTGATGAFALLAPLAPLQARRSGGAGGTTTQPNPSSTSVELTTGNPEAHDYLDHARNIDHPAPYGYEGDD